MHRLDDESPKASEPASARRAPLQGLSFLPSRHKTCKPSTLPPRLLNASPTPGAAPPAATPARLNGARAFRRCCSGHLSRVLVCASLLAWARARATTPRAHAPSTMGGVLGRLFKVKKLELVLVGIENSCEPRPTAPAWLFRRSTLCQPRLGPRRLAPRRGRWRGPAPRAGGPEARRVRSRPCAGASLLA